MLPADSRLGPYQIVRPVGAGGMGQVYEARDAVGTRCAPIIRFQKILARWRRPSR
jgi:serine/threonine protein kinase